jgi:hypothetical protein
MADFIIGEDNPDFLETNVEADDVDIDHMAINFPLSDDRTEEVLKSLLATW